jgi:TPP-dependent pyruvate/acetoin dehydrogenase alpha subunit
LRQPENREAVLTALRIRAVESALYDAFGKGQLHGTIHTCIGQEFSGVAICQKLRATTSSPQTIDATGISSQQQINGVA